MKQLFFILLLGCFACNRVPEIPKNGTKDILNVTPLHKLFEPVLKVKYLNEMNVYHGEAKKGEKIEHSYFVNAYFSNYNDAYCGYISETLYDKVQFHWINDSLLRLKIYNSKNNNSAHITFSSPGQGILSMDLDTINGVPH